MECFEDLCIKILDGVEYRAKQFDVEGILKYIEEMREQVEMCRNVSKNER